MRFYQDSGSKSIPDKFYTEQMNPWMNQIWSLAIQPHVPTRAETIIDFSKLSTL